jgi:hypothetical protein
MNSKKFWRRYRTLRTDCLLCFVLRPGWNISIKDRFRIKLGLGPCGRMCRKLIAHIISASCTTHCFFMDLIWCKECLCSIVSWFYVCSCIRQFSNAYLSAIFLRHILALGIRIAVVLLAEVVLWLGLARSTGSIWVGVSPHITWRRK